MKESDIRSRDVQDHYLALCERDAAHLLASRGDDFVEVHCPACDSPDRDIAFVKQGYTYRLCRSCATLYLSPRPTDAILADFNSTSDNARYWADEFYPRCAEKRRNSVYRPRAEFARDLQQTYSTAFRSLLDVGTGYGIYLEELRKVFPDVAEIIGLEPGRDLARVCRARGLDVIEGFLADTPELAARFDFVSCFEVLEHVFSPVDFLREVAAVGRPGAVLFTNTLCADGLDIQIMWQRHRNVYPANHINILSVRGFELLFQRAGYADVRVTTPGRLDVDIIRSQMPPEEIPRFLRTMYARGDEDMLRRFQAFLAESRLSSHAWIVARKP